MQIVGGPGEHRLCLSHNNRDSLPSKRRLYRVVFKCTFRGVLAGFSMAITKLSKREDSSVYDFEAEDAIGQTFVGWYDVSSKEGEIRNAEG